MLVALAWVGTDGAAEDTGALGLQQQLLQRQQQQDALQLRMLQQQRAVQSPPPAVRDLRSSEERQFRQQQRQRRLQEQLQQQQQLHDRQSVEAARPRPVEDAGTRQAKQEIERQRAARESAQLLQRLDSEIDRR